MMIMIMIVMIKQLNTMLELLAGKLLHEHNFMILFDPLPSCLKAVQRSGENPPGWNKLNSEGCEVAFYRWPIIVVMLLLESQIITSGLYLLVATDT